MRFFRVLFLTLTLPLVAPAIAQNPIQAEAVASKPVAAPGRHRLFPNTGSIVRRYIDEKTASGEIDPTEYQHLVEQRNSLREELKTLRASGDQAAIEAKMQELRLQRRQQRGYVRELIDDNPDLRQQIIDRRQQARHWRLKRRQDLIERRMERLRDQRRRDPVN